jgi:hypothetical protein
MKKSTKPKSQPAKQPANKSTSIIKQPANKSISKPKAEKIKRSVELKKLIGNKRYHYYVECEQWCDVTRLRYSQIFPNEESALDAKEHNEIEWKSWHMPNGDLA